MTGYASTGVADAMGASAPPLTVIFVGEPVAPIRQDMRRPAGSPLQAPLGDGFVSLDLGAPGPVGSCGPRRSDRLESANLMETSS